MRHYTRGPFTLNSFRTVRKKLGKIAMFVASHLNLKQEIIRHETQKLMHNLWGLGNYFLLFYIKVTISVLWENKITTNYHLTSLLFKFGLKFNSIYTLDYAHKTSFIVLLLISGVVACFAHFHLKNLFHFTFNCCVGVTVPVVSVVWNMFLYFV